MMTESQDLSKTSSISPIMRSSCVLDTRHSNTENWIRCPYFWQTLAMRLILTQVCLWRYSVGSQSRQGIPEPVPAAQLPHPRRSLPAKPSGSAPGLPFLPPGWDTPGPPGPGAQLLEEALHRIQFGGVGRLHDLGSPDDLHVRALVAAGPVPDPAADTRILGPDPQMRASPHPSVPGCQFRMREMPSVRTAALISPVTLALMTPFLSMK